MSSSALVACPYDDCQNQISVPSDVEEADILVCRSHGETEGCNRNTEVTSVKKDGDTISVDIQVLEVDEDWGE